MINRNIRTRFALRERMLVFSTVISSNRQAEYGDGLYVGSHSLGEYMSMTAREEEI